MHAAPADTTTTYNVLPSGFTQLHFIPQNSPIFNSRIFHKQWIKIVLMVAIHYFRFTLIIMTFRGWLGVKHQVSNLLPCVVFLWRNLDCWLSLHANLKKIKGCLSIELFYFTLSSFSFIFCGYFDCECISVRIDLI